MSRLLLTCATPEYTGPAELMLEDATTLRAAGHDVTLGLDTRRPGSLRARVEAQGFPIDEGLDLCRLARPGAILRDVLHLRAAFRAARYELVWTRFSHDHHAALFAARPLGARRPRILRSAELLANVAPGLARGAALRRTDLVVVPSEAHAALLREAHGLGDERIALLPGRVDAARFTPGPSGLRAELGVPSDAPVVGIVSRIKPDRLHARLVGAFARALERVPSARLVIVGRGEGREEVEALVRARGLEAAVHFAGYRTDAALVDAYRAFDVKAWIAPGNDGTCRAVLEAMACGAAVLGGRFGAVADSVVEGETGALREPSDEAALAGALVELLGDRARARRLGAAGRARVLQNFRPEDRAARVRALVARALAASPLS